MRVDRRVDAHYGASDGEVSLVVRGVRRRVVVVVAAVAVRAEPVEVLHAQVQVLWEQLTMTSLNGNGITTGLGYCDQSSINAWS